MTIRLIIIACGLTLLAACDFRPVYGNYGVLKDGTSKRAHSAFAKTLVQPIDGRLGRVVWKTIDSYLHDGVPQYADPFWRLEIALEENRAGLAVERDDTFTRYNYHLNAHWRLVSLETNEVAAHGNSSTIAAYNVVQNQYATQVAEEDAERRAAREIAEDIRLRLALHFDAMMANGQ